MASTTSTRMWRAYKAAGRPWPNLDGDEVVDYLILEALAVKAGKEDKEALKNAEIEKWKKETQTDLEAFR